MNWKVAYTDFPQQFERDEAALTDAFKRVMSAGDFILRDEVTKFEESMAKYLGVKHVIGVNSGTDALYLSVKAAGLSYGDEVITVSHTFIATLSAIRNAGAVPVIVDTGDDYCMDVARIDAMVTADTKAILPVHLNGRMCDMESIGEIAERHGLLVIEDACQSLGASISDRKAGSWGLAGCFSTHPMKVLSGCGDGGFVSTNNDVLAEKLREMRNHKGEPFGFNSRLDNLQAALLNVKFTHLWDDIQRRREIAFAYDYALSKLPLRLPPAPQGDPFDVYNSYVVGNGHLTKHLREQGIEAFSHLSNDVCSLPIHHSMSSEDIGVVIDAVRSYFD
jgi:dTDP-4-amino-4,6-dideoxygalactose transaminase